MPPEDRTTTITVLPKQSNFSLVKPLNLAVSFQEKQRADKNVELFLSAQSTKFKLGNSKGQTTQVFQQMKKKKVL